jgi:hypothetical protein
MLYVHSRPPYKSYCAPMLARPRNEHLLAAPEAHVVAPPDRAALMSTSLLFTTSTLLSPQPYSRLAQLTQDTL